MFGIEVGFFEATVQYSVAKKGFRWSRKPINDNAQFFSEILIVLVL